MPSTEAAVADRPVPPSSAPYSAVAGMPSAASSDPEEADIHIDELASSDEDDEEVGLPPVGIIRGQPPPSSSLLSYALWPAVGLSLLATLIVGMAIGGALQEAHPDLSPVEQIRNLAGQAGAALAELPLPALNFPPSAPLTPSHPPAPTSHNLVYPPAPSHPLFSNYTVSPFWAARYPTPLSDLRGVVVSVWAGDAPSLREEFQRGWPLKEANFLSLIANHSDHIIFYTVWPKRGRQPLQEMAGQFGWQLLEGEQRTILPFVRARGNFSLQSEGDEYVSPKGVHILLYPIIVSFPHWLTVDAGLLERRDWGVCANNGWSLEYELYSGAMFNHRVLSHPLLSAYDFYLKMDLDIEVPNPIPYSPFVAMAEQGCVWMHTEWLESGRSHDQDCSAEADLAGLEWATRTGHYPPAALGTDWWHGKVGYYYGTPKHSHSSRSQHTHARRTPHKHAHTCTRCDADVWSRVVMCVCEQATSSAAGWAISKVRRTWI